MQTQLTRRDYEDFMVRLYFGSEAIKWPLAACIHKAYADFQRTLHGITKLPKKDQVKENATLWLTQTIAGVTHQSGTINQAKFDHWHEDTCRSLQDIYTKAGFHCFRIGQSQKWLNMAFKYIFTLGEERIRGYRPLYEYCHVPFDNIMLIGLKRYGFRGFSRPWSRLDNYPEYRGGAGVDTKEYPDAAARPGVSFVDEPGFQNTRNTRVIRLRSSIRAGGSTFSLGPPPKTSDRPQAALTLCNRMAR